MATGCRSARIIILQCSSSTLWLFPKLSCPIKHLDLFSGQSSYTDKVRMHSLIWDSGSVKIKTSLNTVTSLWVLSEVFWCLILHWLHTILVLAYKAKNRQKKFFSATSDLFQQSELPQLIDKTFQICYSWKSVLSNSI